MAAGWITQVLAALERRCSPAAVTWPNAPSADADPQAAIIYARLLKLKVTVDHEAAIMTNMDKQSALVEALLAEEPDNHELRDRRMGTYPAARSFCSLLLLLPSSPI
jgi:hypothetical protein